MNLKEEIIKKTLGLALILFIGVLTILTGAFVGLTIDKNILVGHPIWLNHLVGIQLIIFLPVFLYGTRKRESWEKNEFVRLSSNNYEIEALMSNEKKYFSSMVKIAIYGFSVSVINIVFEIISFAAFYGYGILVIAFWVLIEKIKFIQNQDELILKLYRKANNE